MGTFDFLSGHAHYSMTDVHRMNTREAFIVAPFKADIAGARVLDLAAHDGRWSYALSLAGAREVLGIEGRPELVARFGDMPPGEVSERITLRVADIFDELQRLGQVGEEFDVVALYGVFYHVMDHFLLLKRIMALRPRLIIVDSEFISMDSPVMQLVRERTDNPLNALADYSGQEVTIKGIPSTGAMEAMADVLGHSCEWIDWDHLPLESRKGVGDYFRQARKRRRTCALKPYGDGRKPRGRSRDA